MSAGDARALSAPGTQSTRSSGHAGPARLLASGFALFRYRRFDWRPALLAAALAGAMAATLDLLYYYPIWAGTWKTTYVVLVVASTVAVSGLLGPVLVRALARTGALSSFAAGRTRV